MADVLVFLVEDDPMVQQLHQDLVSGIPGFRVVGRAADGDSALSGITETKPDLVILDVYMPGQNGLELLRSLRSQITPIDVIMVTAAHEPSVVTEALRLGAFDYLIKPFRFERLREALLRYRQTRVYLDGRELTQQDVDAMRMSMTTHSQTDLPKGLVAQTLTRIKRLLAAHEAASFSAEEVAESIGVSRITARRYLEYLVQARLVRSEPTYGGVGRPVNRYAWIRSKAR